MSRAAGTPWLCVLHVHQLRGDAICLPTLKRGQITLHFAGVRCVLGDIYCGSAHRQEIVKFQ